MNDEIAIREEQLPVAAANRLVPTEQELAVYDTMARMAAESKHYQSLGGASGVAAIMLYAREIGIQPMQAISGGVRIVQGKIEISPQAMNRKIREAGHSIHIVENTDKKCVITGRRRDDGDELTAEFTIEQAKRAGLVKQGSGWEKYPEDMLFARCLSRLARRLFPDVIGTSYVFGEIQEVIDVTPRTVSTKPAKVRGRVREESPSEEPQAEEPRQEAQAVVDVTPEPPSVDTAADIDESSKLGKKITLGRRYLRAIGCSETAVYEAERFICRSFDVDALADLQDNQADEVFRLYKGQELKDHLIGEGYGPE